MNPHLLPLRLDGVRNQVLGILLIDNRPRRRTRTDLRYHPFAVNDVKLVQITGNTYMLNYSWMIKNEPLRLCRPCEKQLLRQPMEEHPLLP
jgi:hypothetical protein